MRGLGWRAGRYFVLLGGGCVVAGGVWVHDGTVGGGDGLTGNERWTYRQGDRQNR